jgi:magnesium-transporting ATPase (P-type)
VAGRQAVATPALSNRRTGRRHREASARARGTRSYGDIVWTNTFTVFNLILGVLLGVILAFGNWRDGLFGGVIIANTAIGIIQEVRAKRTLDRLALLLAPRARVLRDGGYQELLTDDLAVGDLVRLEPGDQIVADGRLVEARGLEVDESILTGESEAVHKQEGDEVLSGAFCVAGSGTLVVEAVGADSFAERLGAEARGTRSQLSPLQLDINRILRVTVAGMVPLAVVLVATLAIREEPLVRSAHTAVAALVPLVPEGLVLLTSLTFAVAAVRLARLGALAQRLNAVESLASVDVVCVDKTGTLTNNRLAVVAVHPAQATTEESLREVVGAFAASVGARNATMNAIHDAMAEAPRDVVAEVPFSSARKWSGATLADVGTVVVGAPDVLERHGVVLDPHLERSIAEHAANRRRVLLVATGDGHVADDAPLPKLRAAGVVALSEGLRPDAIDTVRFLRTQGTTLKVISGDGVATVQAVATACGVPHADRAVSSEDLPTDPAALEQLADETVVFARITPEQKRDIVAALTRRGRYVAMIGDGVNDVLALKEARLAIAMGSGSQIAKGVSDLVLLRGGFATVPAAIEEGRRIVRNTHRVAKLFVTKTVYAAVLLATIGLAPIAFPFLPRHLTVTASLTIGIPAFFLALAPSAGPVRRDRFMRDLVRFTVPSGLIVAGAIITGYLIVRGPLDQDVVAGRTAAVIIATAMGLSLVVGLERQSRGGVRWWVWAMVAGFATLFSVGLMLRPLRDFFAVSLPGREDWMAIAVVCVVGLILLPVAERLFGGVQVPSAARSVKG